MEENKEWKKAYVYPQKRTPYRANVDHVCWACEKNIHKGDQYSKEHYTDRDRGRFFIPLEMHLACRQIVDQYGYLFRDKDTFEVQSFKYWRHSPVLKRKDLPVQLVDFLNLVLNFDVYIGEER